MEMINNILNEVNTPFYLYDEKVMERQLNSLLDNKPPNMQIFYAMKGNSNIEILKFFKARKIGTEIASGGELFLANTAGFDPSQIIFTGPAKTDEELENAVKIGIRTIHVESFWEAIRLNRICKTLQKKQAILVRINSQMEVKTKVQLSGCPSPFGISEEDIMDVLPEILALDMLEFQGIHVYNASGILDYNLLLQNVQNVFNLVIKLEEKLSIEIKDIDFGGGLGVDYSDSDQHVKLSSFYNGMHSLIKEFGFSDRNLIMEIARFLMAESGKYVTTIIDKKYSRGEIFLITNGGIHHFMRTALFGENHSAYVINKNISKEKEIVNVTGQLCTSIDVLLNKKEMPKTEIGDHVVIEKAGCYCLNGAINHFLSHEMPVEILMRENNYKIIRKRGSHKDLLINQIL